MQGAYDQRRPNGTGRRALGDRVIYIFRLYRRRDTALLQSLTPKTILTPVREGIRTASNFLRGEVLNRMSPIAGLVLVKEFRFPLILESVDETPTLRSNFSYTQGGFFIDVPFRNARGVTQWRISGRTFWRPVTVNGLTVDGDAALKEFKELVDDLFYPQQGQPSDFELYWLNLNAPVSADDPFGEFEWRIWPTGTGVRTRQTSQRPFIRFFSFDFMGLESNHDKAKAEDGFLEGLLSRGLLRGLLDAFGLDSLSYFADLLDDVFGTIDDLQTLIADAENVITSVTDYVNGVTQFIEVTFAKVRGLLNGVQSIIGRIEDAWEQIRNLPDIFGEQWDLLKQSVPGLTDGDPGKALVASDEARKLRNLLLALLAQPQNFTNLVQAQPLPQSIAVQVSPGATLQSIAHTAGVPIETLIETNQLQYPFVDARERPEHKVSRIESEIEDFTHVDYERGLSGLPPLYAEQLVTLGQSLITARAEVTSRPALVGVLYVGDTIRVPQDSNDVVPSIVGLESSQILSVTGREARILALTGSPVTEEDRLFGFDVLLNSDGNLEWDLDRRDLTLDRGLDHMGRTLNRYMSLPLGSVRCAPGIGNFAYEDMAGWQGPGQNQLLAYALWRTLSQDPRVRQVRSVRAETFAGKATLQVGLELINGRSVGEIRVGVA